MSKKPPNRPGITFEIGARLEALDYLQKWYGEYGAVGGKHDIGSLKHVSQLLFFRLWQKP